MNKSELTYYLSNGFFKSPKILQVEITTYCPLRCPYCYKESMPAKHMSFKLFQKIVDEAYDLGVNLVCLNGGEPFLHPRVFDMIHLLADRQIGVGIITSGVYYDQVGFSSLSHLDCLELLISLNGSTKEINERSRDGYDKAIGLLKFLSNSSVFFKYGINWVARDDNVDDLPNVAILAKKYGCAYVNIVCNKVEGNGKVTGALNEQDYRKLISIIDTDVDFFRIQNCFGVLIRYMKKPYRLGLEGCQAGIRSCAVNVSGLFQPCTHIPRVEYFISIKDYWANSSILPELRRKVPLNGTTCSNCRFGGRCRFCHAMTSETLHDLCADYQRCPLHGNEVTGGKDEAVYI